MMLLLVVGRGARQLMHKRCKDTPRVFSCRYQSKLATSLSVHVLGAGSTGCLLAYHLQRAARAAQIEERVCLQLRRAPEAEALDENKLAKITVRDAGQTELGKESLMWNVTNKASQPRAAASTVDVLVLTTKADQSIEALRPLASRLTDTTRANPSTVVLVQNGVGLDEELVNMFGWRDDPNAPLIVRCINSNGTWSKKRFETVHAGRGTLQFGLSAFTADRLGHVEAQAVMDSNDSSSSPQTQTLSGILRLFRNEEAQSALGTSFCVKQLDFDVAQQRKLVSNCVMNPLTALYDLQNGQLRTHIAARTKAEEIIVECAQILDLLYRSKGIETPDGLTEENLRSYVWQVVDMTQNNYSSTVQDIWTARGSTEIGYLNGTMVRWAEMLNVSAPHNLDMVDRMHAKAQHAFLSKQHTG